MRRRRDARWARLARVVLLGPAVALALSASSAAGGPDVTTAGAASPSRACGTAQSPPARYRHVIWIWFENHAYDAVAGSRDAPYTNRLAATCGLATNYHNITHPSLPNYIAATSGGTQGIADDCEPADCSRGAASVFGQVQAAGMTWAAYDESMPAPCDLSGGSGSNPSGDYAPKHNPAVYYLPLRGSCRGRDLPLGTPSQGPLAGALRSGRLAAFTFVTPNLCNDTHDCPVATGDAWLARWMPAILSSAAYRTGRTAVFVTWDEGEGGSSSACTTNTTDPGCHVATIVVSPSTPRGTRSALLFNHYSLLKTTEQLLGLRPLLGHAGDRGTRGMGGAFGL
jgi:phosphatidylinositol-3-phosphatase